MTNLRTTGQSDSGHDLFKGMAKKKAKDTKKAVRQQVRMGEHSRYQIKSGLLAGEFVARAFPKSPSTARGLIAEATGDTEEAAIAALHDLIDARESQRVDARREDPRTGHPVPSVGEYIEAIGQVALTAPQRAILIALSLADPEGLNEPRLARAGGYKSQASAKRSFASAGQSIATYLASGTDSSGTISGSDGLSFLGFQEEPQDDEKTGNWILHPELRDAVRAAL